MKKVIRLTTVLAVLAGSLMFQQTAMADVSYNIGWASEYHYRGILQKNSSASAGIDFEEGGFYVGAWTADVGDGLEIDGYFGYGIETESGFSASVGFTGYYYTGEFDDTYEEINLGVGYGWLSVGYSFGEYENFSGPELDYDFLEATVDFADTGFYATFGSFGDDFDGDYIEVGYGVTISEIDFGVSVIRASDELSDQLDSSGNATEGESIVFSIGKTF